MAYVMSSVVLLKTMVIRLMLFDDNSSLLELLTRLKRDLLQKSSVFHAKHDANGCSWRVVVAGRR